MGTPPFLFKKGPGRGQKLRAKSSELRENLLPFSFSGSFFMYQYLHLFNDLVIRY
jgi:hypothetical protein